MRLGRARLNETPEATVKKILARGKIVSEDEARVAQEVLASLDGYKVSKESRRSLDGILCEFELSLERLS